MAASYDNEEKGLPQQQTMLPSAMSCIGVIKSVLSKGQSTADQYPPISRPPVSSTLDGTTATTKHESCDLDAPLVDAPLAELPSRGKLATYRRIIGITSAREHKDDQHRPAENLGIYKRVVTNEKKALLNYNHASKLINGCLGLQLIVAASLTALGAGDGPHAAVTVFGAVNTIIAGFLTYLKGSGLPESYKRHASGWTKVREFMEQREREFERADCPLDVEDVIRTVERMYEEVRQDVAANEPGTYTSTAQIKNSDGVDPSPGLAGRRSEMTRTSSYNKLGAESYRRQTDTGTAPHFRAQDYEPGSRYQYGDNQGFSRRAEGAERSRPNQYPQTSHYDQPTQTQNTQPPPRPADDETISQIQPQSQQRRPQPVTRTHTQATQTTPSTQYPHPTHTNEPNQYTQSAQTTHPPPRPEDDDEISEIQPQSHHP
jgi:hypothetical protein